MTNYNDTNNSQGANPSTDAFFSDDALEQMNDTLRNNYLLIEVQQTGWTGTYSNQELAEETARSKHATTEALSITQRLLTGNGLAELKAVNKAKDAIRRYVNENSQPWSTARGNKTGPRIVSIGASIEILAHCATLDADFKAQLEELIKSYDHHVQLSLSRAGDIADPAMYPTKEEVREKFTSVVNPMPVSIPSDFRMMDGPQGAVVASYAESMVAQQAQKIMVAQDEMKAALVRVLMHYTVQVTRIAEGDTQPLYQTTVSNLQRAVDLAHTGNIANCPKINHAMPALDRLCEYPTTVWKNNLTVAGKLASIAQATLASLDPELARAVPDVIAVKRAKAKPKTSDPATLSDTSSLDDLLSAEPLPVLREITPEIEPEVVRTAEPTPTKPLREFADDDDYDDDAENWFPANGPSGPAVKKTDTH